MRLKNIDSDVLQGNTICDICGEVKKEPMIVFERCRSEPSGVWLCVTICRGCLQYGLENLSGYKEKKTDEVLKDILINAIDSVS